MGGPDPAWRTNPVNLRELLETPRQVAGLRSFEDPVREASCLAARLVSAGGVAGESALLNEEGVVEHRRDRAAGRR